MARSNYEKFHRDGWKNPWFEWFSGGVYKHIEHLYVVLIFLPGNHLSVIPWQSFTLFWHPTSQWIKLPVTLRRADSFDRIANNHFCDWCFERRKQNCHQQWRWILRLYRQFISADTRSLSDRYLTIQMPPIRPIAFFPRSGNGILNFRSLY